MHLGMVTNNETGLDAGSAESKKRASLRLRNPELKKKYENLAIEESRSVSQLIEQAMEIAYPQLVQRSRVMKGFLMPVGM